MKKVWLIDDDPVFRDVFRHIMNGIGCVDGFSEFENGQLAYDQLLDSAESKQLPDVIFLDISMPTMNGWHFLDATRDVNGGLLDIAVYLITSSLADADRHKGKQFSYLRGCLSKPVTPNQMDTLLKAL